MIKLFITDMDGTLTDGNVFYSKNGEELKQFSHRDGRGIFLLNQHGVKTCFLTSETCGINAARANRLLKFGTLHYFQNGELDKVDFLKKISIKIGIDLKTEAAFIGDDTTDDDVFDIIGTIACPADAVGAVRKRKNINIMSNSGGHGAVREFIDLLFNLGMI